MRQPTIRWRGNCHRARTTDGTTHRKSSTDGGEGPPNADATDSIGDTAGQLAMAVVMGARSISLPG
ncbi:hypothetical protein NY08_2072 [Rhodococcus sp. B7740]|nr:hypothetical protein NY08_2072 [Rhodococcus sp. B7740]